MKSRLKKMFHSTVVQLPLDQHIRLLRASIREDRDTTIIGAAGVAGTSFLIWVSTQIPESSMGALGFFIDPLFDAPAAALSAGLAAYGVVHYRRHGRALEELRRTLRHE